MNGGNLDELYGLPGELVSNSVQFSEEVINKTINAIYQKEFNIDRELEPNLYQATVKLMNDATVEGLSKAAKAPGRDFLTQLKNNNEVFAAFRTHSMQNDIAALLTDADGQLRTFSSFAKEALNYTDHQNRAWLRTEYNTAVQRAHQAADWQQFEADKDVLPNLKWEESTSITPGEDHRIFWGVVAPIDDPFWDQHRPGDRWGCKCYLSNCDEAPTELPQEYAKNDLPQPGLDENPGKSGELFSESHPYRASDCGSCPFGKGKLWALVSGATLNCAACDGLHAAIK